jgi:membrane-associated phospholipid phosphatase
MDITYLLWLQDFRNATDNVLSPFLMEVSKFAVGLLILIPVFIYWAVNKRDGLFILTAYALSNVISGIVKLTFCVYRPWIRDARVIPYGNSIKSAGGYSFPSGHTMESSPIYGGIAVLTRKKAPLISWLCIIAIILTAISRNYLGVHTPQDVIVGTVLGLMSLWIASKITGYICVRPERENMILITGMIAFIASLAYFELKPYPMDYADGKLIVNPVSMIAGSARPLGIFAGLIIGRCIEKTFVKFNVERFTMKGAVLALIGMIPIYFMYHGIRHLVSFLGSIYANLTEGVVLAVYVIAVWPLVLKLFKAGED